MYQITKAGRITVAICLGGILLFAFASAAWATNVKLKSGRMMTGHIVTIDDEKLTLRIAGGKVWFTKEQVESIDDLSWDEVKASMSTVEAYIAKDKEKTILASAQEGYQYIAKTRNLEYKTKPPIEIITKAKLKDNLRKETLKAYTQEELEARAKLLEKLGLIDDAQQYARDALDMTGESVAGYYTPEEKKIYICDEDLGPVWPGLPSTTVLHEQVHALQDEYHDLTAIHDKLTAVNQDIALAAQGIIEGEATVLMWDAYLRASGEKSEKFDIRSFAMDMMFAQSKHFKTEEGRPAVFMEDMMFPYVWGGKFIQHIVDTKGWSAVDSLYEDMPVSSEQIMHPEKYYIARDNPREVILPDLSAAFGPDWRKIDSNTFGEFTFYLVGKYLLDELSAKIMSEGWGGDRYELYEAPGTKQTALISESVWDTDKDAKEFFDQYKKILEKKYKDKTVIKEENNILEWQLDKAEVYISCAKDTVTLIEGAPKEILIKLKEAFKL